MRYFMLHLLLSIILLLLHHANQLQRSLAGKALQRPNLLLLIQRLHDDDTNQQENRENLIQGLQCGKPSQLENRDVCGGNSSDKMTQKHPTVVMTIK